MNQYSKHVIHVCQSQRTETRFTLFPKYYTAHESKLHTSTVMGFDPLTVHPVGSRYTDYATRPTTVNEFQLNLLLGFVAKFYCESLSVGN
jgi:hypothetical protein